MPSISAAFFSPIASAEAARLAAADTRAAFPVGATITASYRYQVGRDGALVLLQTQITTTAPEDNASDAQQQPPRRNLREGLAEKHPALTQLARPKPSLSPSEELAVFADGEDAPSTPLATSVSLAQLSIQTPSSALLTQAKAEASDEHGQAVEAQLLTPEGDPLRVRHDSLLANIQARAQFAVAGLYARNHAIAYTATPLAQLAA